MQPHRKPGVAEADTCLGLGTYMGFDNRPINIEKGFLRQVYPLLSSGDRA
jgi:hypothetical protein